MFSVRDPTACFSIIHSQQTTDSDKSNRFDPLQFLPDLSLDRCLVTIEG